jgi:magnesium-transporting ATPase (P-type)
MIIPNIIMMMRLYLYAEKPANTTLNPLKHATKKQNNNNKTFSGMGNKALPLFAFRDGMWANISSEDLLPGDLVSMQPSGTRTTPQVSCCATRAMMIHDINQVPDPG